MKRREFGLGVAAAALARSTAHGHPHNMGREGEPDGRIILAGPSQPVIKTLAQAYAAASDGDTIRLDKGATFNETLAIAKRLTIDGQGADEGIGGATIDGSELSLAGDGKGLLVINANVTLTGLVLVHAGDAEEASRGTAAVRLDAGCSTILIDKCAISDSQDGIGSIAGSTAKSVMIRDTLIQTCGLSDGLSHNIYCNADVAQLSLLRVRSINPNSAHALKYRGASLTVTDSYLESQHGSCWDLPNGSGTTALFVRTTCMKPAASGDGQLGGYAEEGQSSGLAGMTFSQCVFNLQRAAPLVAISAGTITFNANCIWIGNELTASGRGLLVGAQVPDNLTVTYVVPSGPRAGRYVYSETGGTGQTVTHLTSYVDPDGDFAMSCIAVKRADAPLLVIFRRVPGWQSAIFECCDALATTDQHMMPNKGDLNTVTINGHASVQFWGQWALGRWRWQSGTWPFMKDPAVLRTKKWLPLWDGNALAAGPPRAPRPAASYTPMHIPRGWPLHMGGGGDPTLFTERQGYYAHDPAVATMVDMNTEIEGVAAYPWFMRDPNTFGPPDIWNRYPTKTTWVPNSAHSYAKIAVVGLPKTYCGNSKVVDNGTGSAWALMWLPYCYLDGTGHAIFEMHSWDYPGASKPSGTLTFDPPINGIVSITFQPGTYMQGSGLEIDEAHSGGIWHLPWISTGDPYFLEAMHCKYLFNFIGAARTPPRAHLRYGQIRATAWILSSLMVSAATTPEHVPGWVLPRSLWKGLWDHEMALWTKDLVNGTTPGSTVFHCLGVTVGGGQEGPSLATWQEDMILQVMSWAAMMMPEYKWAAAWKAQDQIARTNGASGWCANYPEVYYMLVGHYPGDSSWFNSWQECWDRNAAAVPPNVRSPCPATLASSDDYCGQLRCGMAFATQAGIPGVAEHLSSLTSK